MKVAMPHRRKARIEMLPLIDIVFLLLVFFIYAMLSMAVHRGLPVELPVSSAAGPEKDEVISVTVSRPADGKGMIMVNEVETGLGDLDDRLRDLAAGRDSGVLLFADRRVTYQELFRVLDQISRAGLSRISLQADDDR